MSILAIDFGTSTTVSAVSRNAAASQLISVDGSPLLPSSVFLTDQNTLAVGQDADRQARVDPSRYEPNPKRRIDDGVILLGHGPFPVVDVVAAVLSRIRLEVQRQQIEACTQLRLTHPAGWGNRRLEVLFGAARKAGFYADVAFIPEPVAAAAHYASSAAGRPQAGDTLAIYDLGAGTFDVAIVQRIEETWHVVAEAGLPDLGGVDFDHAILECVRAQQTTKDAIAWSAVFSQDDDDGRRRTRMLRTDIRDCKEALSRFPHADIPLPYPLRDFHLTRGEFEGLIRSQLQRSIDLLGAQIERVGMTPHQLLAVYLVGGSSRIPLVARLCQEQLGITPVTRDQPEIAVATGALLVPTDSTNASEFAPENVCGAHTVSRGYPVVMVGTIPPPDAIRQEKPSAAGRGPSSRWYVAILAVVILGILGGLFTVIRNEDPQQPQSSSESDFPPEDSSSPQNFDNFFSQPKTRNYMQPIYSEINQCEWLELDSGRTPLCQIGEAFQVQVSNDMQFGALISEENSEFVRQGTWLEETWQSENNGGILRSFTAQDTDSLTLYWDRNDELWGILNVQAEVTDQITLSMLQQTWEELFRR